MRLHHVQLSCPVGGEDGARRFWVEGMGLVEVAKPPVLAARGGAWFRGGAVEVHVGVEEPFVPARRAHPALVEVADLVTEMTKVKHQMDRGQKGQRGIEW